MQKEKLVGFDGLCDTLSVSRRTAIRLRDSGAIPAVKIGKLVRFKQSDIEAFIERGCIPAYKTRRPHERVTS